jgi:20S proteasome alpha/beta subunit
VTLLVCLKSEGKLVLACDSRATFGDPRGVTAQNDVQIKLFPLTERVGMMIGGVGELGATTVQVLQRELSDPKTGVDDVVLRASSSLSAMFDRWFPDDKFQVQPLSMDSAIRPDINAIIAGFPAVGGPDAAQPQIYSLISQLNFAPLLHNYGFALGGVAQYALYLLNRIYEPDIRLDRAISLAHYVVTETASQDGKVGGPVRMATIDSASGYQPVKESTLSQLPAKDRKVNEEIAKLFTSSVP